MTKWFALDQNGDIVYLGEFESFEAADESCRYSPIWIVSEERARQWLSDLKGFLE